jgi:hypothetical protein
MTLQNLGPSAADVRLGRVMDINANGLATNNVDAGRFTAVFREEDVVTMTALTTTDSPVVSAGINGGITFCTVPATPMPNIGDAKGWVIYHFGTMNTGKKKVVKVGYRAM